MASRLTIAACSLLIALLTPVYGVTVTPGIAYARPVTASTTAGTDAITITAQPPGEQQFEIGQIISLSGLSGYKIVKSFTQVGNPATTSTTLHVENDDHTPFVAASTATGLSVRLMADYLDHTSVRIWSTTDVNSCASVWYDTAYHATAASYQYRSNETSCGYYSQAIDVIGITPNTRWHFRINAKTLYGTDNSAACNDDSCGSFDMAFTTPPDNHSADGRPPMPTAPEPVASHVTSPVDTSAYQVVQVPQFPDGVVTGSIATGSTTLTVNTVPSGMAVNQWIVINGTTCNFGNAPWCKIAAVSGNTITLDRPSTATVSNAAVSWAVVTIQQLLYDKVKTYGTVFEFAQGYRAKMWPTDWEAGHDGVRIPGLPLDDNAQCATHPCSIDDPAHRWIVFRTAATPGSLPPFGVRTGPEYASVLGGVELQGPTAYAFVLSEHGNNSMPAHHIRFENLASVPLAMSSSAADPNWFGGFIDMHWGENMPQYVAVDRIYMDSPSPHTRAMGITWAGKHMALTNSYVRAEYWRPWVAHYGPDSATYREPSTSGNTITFAGFQWQRNRSQPLVTQGAATITAAGTATAAVAVWVVMDATVGNGVEVRYTAGKGVSVNCSGCRAVTALADPTPAVTQKAVYYGEIASGSSGFTYSRTYPDSLWTTEGPDGILATDGDHWLVENNHVESYCKGFFVDVPTPRIVRPPEHITLRRNHFYWNQDHRATSTISNGYNYGVRHVGIEFKRGLRILIEGNEFEGGWAGINHGTAITISETAYETPVNGKVEDLTVRYNVFHNVSESFAINPHYVGAYPAMGADVDRVYYGQNLTYDQDGWRQHTTPAVYFYGKQGLYCGHDIIVEHNTIFDAHGNLPLIDVCGEDRGEGIWMANNVWHGNVGAYGYFSTQRENSGLAPIPDTIRANHYGGATYDTGWNSFTARLTGSPATVPTFTFRNNAVICGSLQGSTPQDDHLMGSDVDFTSADCSAHQARFGSLASQNYFVMAGASKAERTAAMKWASPAAPAYDFRYQGTAPYLAAATTTDGRPIGADVHEIARRRGVVSNLAAVDVRGSGVRGCSGAAGTYCTTLVAIVPDKGTSCRAVYGVHGSAEASWTWTAVNTSTGDSRAFPLQGLAAGTYDYRIRCAGAPPSGAGSFTAP